MKRKAQVKLVPNDLTNDRGQRIFKAKEDHGWLKENELYYLVEVRGQIVILNHIGGGQLSMGYMEFITRAKGHHLYLEIDGKAVASSNPNRWKGKNKVPKIGLDFIKRYTLEGGKIEEVILDYNDNGTIKFRSNGTVIISAIPVENFTRQQMIDHVREAINDYVGTASSDPGYRDLEMFEATLEERL